MGSSGSEIETAPVLGDRGSGTGAGSSAEPPLIGLTTSGDNARWGVWDRPAVVLAQSYVDAVVASGGVPVLLPPGPDVEAAAAARRVVDRIEALILTGGGDIDPACYGAAAQLETKGVRPDRDRWEIDLVNAALDQDLPVLAICRGAQVLNVALGGTLHQHLPAVVGHVGHRSEPAVLGTTQVQLAPGTLLASILGTEIKVPCYHHQAIHRLGAGVVDAGRADDGTIEAALVPDRRFVVAVQWHPEDSNDPRLFEALLTAVQGHGVPRPGETP